MEPFFTGVADLDRKILEELEDEDVIKICSISKYGEKLCNEMFFRNLMLKKYPIASKYIKVKEREETQIQKQKITWKSEYLKIIFYKDRMKERGFIFTDGNPKLYYDILQKNVNSPAEGMVESIDNNLDDLFQYYFYQVLNQEKMVDTVTLQKWIYDAIYAAAAKRNTDVIKFIVSKEGTKLVLQVIEMLNQMLERGVFSTRVITAQINFLKGFL